MEPVDWADGTPRSPRFDDVYHSRSGALAQSRHVFLDGCRLPMAWADTAHWRILETGFGLGLGFLAAWSEWRADPRRPGRLVFESIEAWPVPVADLRRAGGDEPLLEPLAIELADALATASNWRPAGRRVELAFDADRVRLVIHIGDADAVLAEPGPAADSVFLDGFSPARNPSIWSPSVLAGIGRRSRPGTRLGTWTVAASVRHGLVAAGFDVEKRAGLAPKRHCLAGLRR